MITDEVHSCGRSCLLDLFDEYADATADGYWKETAVEAAKKIIQALKHELKEHGAQGTTDKTVNPMDQNPEDGTEPDEGYTDQGIQT